MFDLRSAYIGGVESHEGGQTAVITMPSKHIEVFYEGRWYPKRLAIGRMIKDKILRRRSAKEIVFME